MDKKVVFDTLQYNDWNILKGNLDIIISNLSTLKKELEKDYPQYFNFDIDIDAEEYEITIEGCRYETDEEYSKRIAHNEKVSLHKKSQKVRLERQEKILYEKLKLKYG